LLKSPFILASISGLVWEWNGGEYVMVVFVIEILKIFENGVEFIHAASSEKTHDIDHRSNTASSKGTPTEAN
jgi:hypothetical protein